VTGWSWAVEKLERAGESFSVYLRNFRHTVGQKTWGEGGHRYLLRNLEEHIFTLAFGAFHGHSVFAFAMDADPCSAEIASSAQQQPPVP
jgi:hypothetical protein